MTSDWIWWKRVEKRNNLRHQKYSRHQVLHSLLTPIKIIRLGFKLGFELNDCSTIEILNLSIMNYFFEGPGYSHLTWHLKRLWRSRSNFWKSRRSSALTWLSQSSQTLFVLAQKRLPSFLNMFHIPPRNYEMWTYLLTRLQESRYQCCSCLHRKGYPLFLISFIYLWELLKSELIYLSRLSRLLFFFIERIS